MFEPTKLTRAQISLAERTISSNALFLIAQDRLLRRLPFSLVRMADGELRLWNEAVTGPDPDLEKTKVSNRDWRVRLGVEGISQAELLQRLNWAATEADYLAPSISGLVNPDFDLYDCFPARERYADIFCFNQWTEEMITQLYKEAKHVILVHRNPDTADAFISRAKEFFNVKVTWIKQESWRQTEGLIQKVKELDAPLVIASVGPAGKYTIPRMSREGEWPKVVLDIGNSVDTYILWETWSKARKLQEAQKLQEA
jgi:hypothetical protein